MRLAVIVSSKRCYPISAPLRTLQPPFSIISSIFIMCYATLRRRIGAD